MNADEWMRVVKPVLPVTDNWAYRGKFAYRRPVRWVATGVFGESSGWSRATYVWRTIVPLFVPTEDLVLSHSERISALGPVQDQDSDLLRSQISAAASTLPTEDQAIHRLARLDLKSQDCRAVETAACAQLISGAAKQSAETLALAHHIARSADDPDWVSEVFARMAVVEQMLAQSRDADALAQLGQWAAESAFTLRLSTEAS